MAQQLIDIGAAPNDGTGDGLRTAFDKVNDNFTELYGSLAGLLDFKGDQNASANPNYPAALKGDAYYITAAGKIGGGSGKSVDIGDLVVAKADNAGGTEASVGTSWFVLEHNLAGALLAANNLSEVASPSVARANLDTAIPSARWIIPEGMGALATGGALGANSMRGCLGYIRKATTFTGLGIYVSTAAASGNARVHVYAAHPTTLAPTGAPIVSSGNLSTAATGAVTQTGMSFTLQPGWYWFFTLCDTNAATAAFQASTNTNPRLPQMLGTATAAAALQGGNATATSLVYTVTFGSPPTLTGNLTADGSAGTSSSVSFAVPTLLAA